MFAQDSAYSRDSPDGVSLIMEICMQVVYWNVEWKPHAGVSK